MRSGWETEAVVARMNLEKIPCLRRRGANCSGDRLDFCGCLSSVQNSVSVRKKGREKEKLKEKKKRRRRRGGGVQ